MTKEASSKHLHQQARKGWLWNGIEQFATRGLSMMVSLILARMLAPESFGLIASVSIFLTTAQQLIDGGIGSRILQKKEIAEEDYTALFWCNAAVSLLTCGSLITFAGAIASFYGNPQLRSVVVVLAAVVFFMNSGRVQTCRLMRELRFKELSCIMMVSVVAGSIVGVGLAFAGCGVWAILGQQLVIWLGRAVALWLVVPWRPAGVPSWSSIKDLYAFGLPLLISQTIRGLSEQLTNVLTARYIGMASLGYYDRGRFIPGNVASFLQCMFFRNNLTILSKLQHDEEEFRSVYLKLIGTIIAVCMLLMTGLAVCAPEIIEIILGPKWAPSVWFFRAGCIMSSIYLLFLINLDILTAKSNIASLFKQNLIYTGLQIVGVGGGLFWGLRGMMTGSIAGCLISCLLLIRAVDRISHITVKDQLSVFIRPVLWSSLTAGLLWGVRHLGLSLWVNFILCGAVGALMMAILWLFAVNKQRSVTGE